MVYQFKILNVTNLGHSSTLIDPQVNIDWYYDLHDELYDEFHNDVYNVLLNDDMIYIMYNMACLEVLSHLKITNDMVMVDPREMFVKFLIIFAFPFFSYASKAFESLLLILVSGIRSAIY